MIASYIKSLRSDSLIRNSFYLMLATASVSGFGFLFWLINTHLFNPTEIGLATALISTISLIALLSQIGINTIFVRFLSKSKSVNADINTGLVLVGTTALILSIGFLITVEYISPKLSFIQSPVSALIFTLYCLCTSLSVLIESIFSSFRRTEHIFVNNSLYSAVKIFLPFAFIPFGTIGILLSATLAQALGVILGLTVLIRKFAFKPVIQINTALLARSWQYSSISYSAAIFNLVPVSLLPIIITNELDATTTAYFYVSMMIGNLLYVVPWSAARSLFAEGSHDEEHIKEHIWKSVRINLVLLTPAIIAIFLFGGFVLTIFGADYAAGSTHFLWFIAATGVPIATSSIFNALLQIKKDPRSNLISNICYGVALISFTYALLPYGLLGVGLAWFLGNAVSATSSALCYFFADYIFKRLSNGTYVPRTIIRMHIRSTLLWIRQGFKRKVVLFYPYKPAWYHFVFIVMHTAGYKITSNPNKPYDVAFSFHDVTIKSDDATLEKLKARGKVINGDCFDISKIHVDEVFARVAGYSTMIDPRTHQGNYVQKSDTNGLHDGVVLSEPTEPKSGYVYQRLINNTCDNEKVRDIRVLFIGGEIPLVIERTRSVHCRFTKTEKIRITEPEELLQQQDLALIKDFCHEFKVDYAELDVLRDNDDGRIYIVDVNLTSGGPVPGKNVTHEEYRSLVNTHLKHFNRCFLS